LLSTGENSYDFSIYPAITALPKTDRGELIKTSNNPLMSTFTVTLPEFSFPAQLTTISRKKMAVTLPSLSPGLNNIYLTIDYTGDTGMGFLDGKLVTDEFYKGIPWQIGLRTFLASSSTRQMVFYFRPLAKSASYLVDLQPYPASIPDFGNAKSYLKINSAQFTPEYKSIITF
jgi:beta-galactosidase